MAYTLSVGQLTDLTRTGDINFRFTSRSSAIEGIKGHQAVQKSRGEAYLAELQVSVSLITEIGEVEVTGRIDGVAKIQDRVVLDEIKTVRVDPDEIPRSVIDSHRHQIKLYAYMLACAEELTEVTARVCYYHLDKKVEHHREETYGYDELCRHFVDTIAVFVDMVMQRRAWQVLRDETLDGLDFPYEGYRTGQRDMAVSVYRAIQGNYQLVMQAPTGIGKTMGAIYPAVQSLVSGAVDKVFYLSARNSTQPLAEKALGDIRRKGAKLRSVTITAKDKICFSPGQPCHPDHCEYARGYYDKVTDAIDDILSDSESLDRKTVEEKALERSLCPFELSLDLSRHCDVIVSDYNYVFDPVVYLRRFFNESPLPYVALIDESHNLVDRGRDMFSATLNKKDFLDLARTVKEVTRPLHKALLAVNRSILDLKNTDREGFETKGYLSFKEAPDKVLKALRKLCESAEDLLREENQYPFREQLLQCYFDSLRFLRTADEFDADYVTLLQKRRKHVTITLYCVDPSRQLKAGFDRLASAVCFSATLRPQQYFSSLIGLDEDALWYGLPSPFPPENLQVVVADYVDTTYRQRSLSAAALVELIYRLIAARKGNYLVFFPSYEYLASIHDLFVSRFPDVDVICQSREMSDEERKTFIHHFESSREAVCGFAVMSGVFAEGIDLKGENLLGAIVVGVGLPQLGIERDLIRDHFPETGFEYAYQYPGITRVLQTAGRVIRDETDWGVVCLVDRRFGEQRYAELLPKEWRVAQVSSADAASRAVQSFWAARN